MVLLKRVHAPWSDVVQVGCVSGLPAGMSREGPAAAAHSIAVASARLCAGRATGVHSGGRCAASADPAGGSTADRRRQRPRPHHHSISRRGRRRLGRGRLPEEIGVVMRQRGVGERRWESLCLAAAHRAGTVVKRTATRASVDSGTVVRRSDSFSGTVVQRPGSISGTVARRSDSFGQASGTVVRRSESPIDDCFGTVVRRSASPESSDDVDAETGFGTVVRSSDFGTVVRSSDVTEFSDASILDRCALLQCTSDHAQPDVGGRQCSTVAGAGVGRIRGCRRRNREDVQATFAASR